MSTGSTVSVDGTLLTISGVISGSGASITKTGTGTATLSGANTYNGGTIVNGGNLLLTGSLPNTATASVTVNNGGTFTFGASDRYGDAATTMLVPFTINAGGTITNSGSYFNALGPVTLNGGTINSVGGFDTSWPSWSFKGGVTVTDNSTINGSGTNAGIQMGDVAVTGTTFTVDNGKTLTVNTPLQNGRDGSWVTQVSAMTKSGAGTMILTSPNNSYTGTTTLNAGTLTLNPSANATFASKLILNGGTLSTLGIASGRTFTSTGALSLTDNSALDLDPTNAHTLTFATSNGETWTTGKLLNVSGWQGAFNGTTGTIGKLFVGSAAGTLTAIQLPRVRFLSNGKYYLDTQLSSGEVVATGSLYNTFLLLTIP
jgi:autotransporter-associated beta strand protein